VKILFLHGWTSVPGGVKPTYLAQHGHEVINPKLPDEDFEEAVRIAEEEFDSHEPDVVVGSSRCGAVEMHLRSESARLVLLCPAWKKWGRARTAKPGTVILHSRADDVVPFADSEELVRNSGLPAIAAEGAIGQGRRAPALKTPAPPVKGMSMPAVLPLTVQSVSVSVPPLPNHKPPPLPPVELPLTVQLVKVVVPPRKYRPPPEKDAGAELPLTVQSVRAVVACPAVPAVARRPAPRP
jgi:hypothetical protein